MYRANVLSVIKRYKSRGSDFVPKNRMLRKDSSKQKDDEVKTSASEAIKLLRALQKSQNEPITKVIIQN